MGCASSKGAADDVHLEFTDLRDRSISALKSGQQDPDVHLFRKSISYQSKELPEGGRSQRDSAHFDAGRIGTHTLHGVMPGPKGTTSKAKINQDRGVVCWPFCGSYNMALLAVFDGHGSRGEKASEFCMRRLPEMLEAEYDALIADPSECLKRTFVAMDEELRTKTDFRGHMLGSGTTATVAYMRGTELWIAYVGDSRVIKAEASKLSPKRKKDKGSSGGASVVAHELSRDHKPDLPAERERIERCGGTIKKGGGGGEGAGSLRVWNKGAVGLAMSRSIGDGAVKEVGVIAEPEVERFELTPASEESKGDLFVLLASDGVWEFIPSQEAAEVVAQYPRDASAGCEALVLLAAERWKAEEAHHRDDITAILAFLPFLEQDKDDDAPELPSVLTPIAETSAQQPLSGKSSGELRYINGGERGITRMHSDPDDVAAQATSRTPEEAAAPTADPDAPAAAPGGPADDAEPPTTAADGAPVAVSPEDVAEATEEEMFGLRRLSVFDPYAGGIEDSESDRTTSWASKASQGPPNS